MREVIPPILLHAFVVCTRTVLALRLTSFPTFTTITYDIVVSLDIKHFKGYGDTNRPQVFVSVNMSFLV
jgi:hypothetical protein